MLASLRSRLSAWIGDASLKRLIKNSSMLFGAETIATLISLVQFPLVTRLLGPEEYGVWGIVVGWVGLVGQIVSFRLWETVVKYVSEFAAQGREDRVLAIIKLCMLIEIIVGLVFTLTLGLSAEWTSRALLRRADGADLIRLETLHLMMSWGSGIWMPLLRVFDRFRRIAVFNTVSAFATFALTLSALALRLGVAGMIVTMTIVALGQTMALAMMAERELRKRFHRHWLTADLGALRGRRREILVMLFSMNIDALRKIAVGNADMVILGWLATPAQVGVYRLAKQLSSFFGRLTNPVYDTLYPEVARLYPAEGPAAVRMLVKRLMKGLLVALGFATAGAYALSPWVVPLIFGAEYRPAIPVFFVILLTNIWVVGLWAPSVMVSAGHAKHLTVINTLASLSMIVALLVLAPRGGGLSFDLAGAGASSG